MKKAKSSKQFKVPTLDTLLRELDYQSLKLRNEPQKSSKTRKRGSSSEVDENAYFTFSHKRKSSKQTLEPSSMSKFFNLPESSGKASDFFKCSLAFRMHKVISSKIENL